MDSVNRFFLMAAGLIVTASLILLGFRLADAGERAGNVMVERFVEFSTELTEEEIMRYDGTTVNGSDVVNFIKKNLSAYRSGGTEPFEIVVETGGVKRRIDSSSLNDITNFSHDAYIMPTGRYSAQVERNPNGIISLVLFTQE